MHKPREVRIGLVLYGGVSLAVYINGVAQEFFRAVRGHGPYRLLKALLGADIVVDVISGTSAGGLNGIYLAYALCQEPQPRNFLDFSDLWRRYGDIDKLLRSPKDPGTESLLDGEGYYQDQLKAAFTRMRAWQADPERPSELSELDLFITGTDFHGFVYTRFDATGRPITVKDHRTLFQLKFRGGRRNDLAPSKQVGADQLHAQLAKLARITSCFPVAFPPVCVEEKKDPQISQWGQLSRKPLTPGASKQTARYYLDGGVLDNKPFSSTIQAIFHRTATRPVTRKMFYVEPAPEVFDPGAGGASPNVVQAGVGALTVIPGYESIAGDLQAIRDRNTQIQRFRALVQEILFPKSGASSQASLPTAEQLGIYRRSRLNLLLDRVLVGLLRQSGHEVLLDAGEQRLASELYAKFYETFSDGDQQERILGDFDVHARLRRLFHVTYALDEVARPAPGDSWAVEVCNRWIKCAEVIRFALEETVDRLPLRWYEGPPEGRRLRALAGIWTETGQALSYVLAADAKVTMLLQAPPDQAALTALHDTLLGRIEELKGTTVVPPAPAPSLLHFLDQHFQLDRFLIGSPAAREAWRRFPRIDLHQFPLQAASGIFESDFIDTVRISPKDAQLGFSRKEASKKLSGDQLANFGGFFKRSWRSNDLLWGRLDGLARIFETLLTREAVNAAPQDPASAAERLSLIASLGLPRGLASWLADLADHNRPGHASALDELDDSRREEQGGPLDQLVRYAQSDLVKDGLEAVAADSIEEQIDWNRCRIGDPGRTSFHIDNLRFTRPNRGFISLAAQRMALEALQRGEIPDLAAFFEKQYAVGEETLAEDVPKPVLAELAARAALVLRNCLLPASGVRGQAIRKSPLFRYGFDWPICAAHGFAQMVRYAPTTARVVTWLAAIYAVAALLAGFKWWKFFIWPQQGLQVSALALMIVVPLVILAALPEMLDWQYPSAKGVVRRYGPWALLTLVAGLTAGGVVWLAELRAALEEFVASRSGPISSGLLAGCAVVAGAILMRVFRWALSLLRKRAALGSDPSLDRQGSEE